MDRESDNLRDAIVQSFFQKVCAKDKEVGAIRSIQKPIGIGCISADDGIYSILMPPLVVAL